jgi:hypothetical protein
MQESRLSLAGIKNHTNRLSKRQIKIRQIKVKHRFAKRSTGSSCHGGVGILTRSPIPLVETGINSQAGRALHESARWCTAAIPMGPVGAPSRRFIHLICFFGIANHGNGAKHTQNERLLKALFEHASALGNQPVYICMDGNTSVENSATLQLALSTSKWFYLAISFSSGNPDMTFCASKTWDKVSTGKGVTRPDYVLANACLYGTISTLPEEATEEPTEVKAGNLIANVGLATRIYQTYNQSFPAILYLFQCAL